MISYFTNNSFRAIVDFNVSPVVDDYSLTLSSDRTSITAQTNTLSATSIFSLNSVSGQMTNTGSYNRIGANVQINAFGNTWGIPSVVSFSSSSSAPVEWTNVAISPTNVRIFSPNISITLTNSPYQSLNNLTLSDNTGNGVTYTTLYSLDNVSFGTNSTFTGLTPNTTYTVYSKAYARYNNRTTISNTYNQQVIKTLCNAPSNLTLKVSDLSSSSMKLYVHADGDINADITDYTVFYKLDSDLEYSLISIGTENDALIDNLTPESDYLVYFTATNDGGTSTSSIFSITTPKYIEPFKGNVISVVGNSFPITVYRGDTCSVGIEINLGTPLEPEIYQLGEFDKLDVRVLKPNSIFENAVIEKELTSDAPVVDDEVIVTFEPEDTEFLERGTYYICAKLIQYDEDEETTRITTILPNTLFYLV